MNCLNNHKPWSVTRFIPLFGLFILMLTSYSCYGRVHQGTHTCEFYDREACLEKGECEPTTQDCSSLRSEDKSFDNKDNYMQCYAIWLYSNSTESPVIVKKGCWLNVDACQDVKECVEKRPVPQMPFCCCDGNNCNKQVYYRPSTDGMDQTMRPGEVEPDGHNDGDIIRRAGEGEVLKTILCSIVPIIVVFVLVVTAYFMWRRHQHQHHLGHHQLPTMDPNLVHSPSETPFSIQLIEHKAKGRFGYVWKAKLHDQFVAVKIFPLADKKSFSAEMDIYKQSNMKHENVLTFIGAEVKEENSYTEFFLITEYHEKGSLYDFLKANTITWAQLCRIGETMTSGLAYLHDEIPGTYNHPHKPAIAHRDFKSKNVLIKSDITACIADFGLALAFDPNMGVNETHTQVGTRRYMAPEVLEGAICFNMDSFLRIDMYACSLVLWELMTRCTCVEDVVDDYRLPFEAEVGLQPSLEEMQPLVAGQKRRPAIKPAWYQSVGMASLVTTMEECWDQDAEARLSAGCVHDRIAQFSRTINTGDSTQHSPPHFTTHHPGDSTQNSPPHFTAHHPATPSAPPQSPHYVPNPPSPPSIIEPPNNNNNTMSNSLSTGTRDLGSSC